ncbi:hypothetical protein SRABI80_03232 [Peribacillus frigoritolerans]|nr:hypothetical protein SRABI80_03232 [Peribacillus frigoritolerans]
MTRLIAAKTAPDTCPPVARNPPTIGGVTHGILATIGKTIPLLTAIYEITVVITGPRTNGMNHIGFRTIGNPKRMGSLIWNTPGAPPSAIICLYRFRPAMIIAMMRPNVAPDPPK